MRTCMLYRPALLHDDDPCVCAKTYCSAGGNPVITYSAPRRSMRERLTSGSRASSAAHREIYRINIIMRAINRRVPVRRGFPLLFPIRKRPLRGVGERFPFGERACLPCGRARRRSRYAYLRIIHTHTHCTRTSSCRRVRTTRRSDDRGVSTPNLRTTRTIRRNNSAVCVCVEMSVICVVLLLSTCALYKPLCRNTILCVHPQPYGTL